MDEPIGHVRIVNPDLVTSTVDPCTYNGVPTNETLPNRSRLELVFKSMGDVSLRFAVDPQNLSGQRLSPERLQKFVSELEAVPTKMVELTDDVRNADWLVRSVEDTGAVQLVPVTGVSYRELNSHREAVPPIPIQSGWANAVVEKLDHIARATNLLRLTTTASESIDDRAWGFELQLNDTQTSEPIAWSPSGKSLKHGQQLDVILHNDGDRSLDVTLLVVDPKYDIETLFPLEEESSRLQPGQEVPFTIEIEADPPGIVNLVAIVVPGRGEPVHFRVLEQSSLPPENTRGDDAQALSSPLGKLLQTAMYGRGETRGGPRDPDSSYGVNVVTWRTERVQDE
jgi:hypothetical protein